MKQALGVLVHRGPDESGMISQPDWIMGQRRLSIIDVQSSRQPMSDVNERYCLSYNGEIYNYKKLRQNLKYSWQFKTEGDTEVLLAGLIQEGPAFLTKLSGMWALALWDNKDKKLLLARDRIGKKPLYYKLQENKYNGISCASELNALFCMVSQSVQEDLNSTADYLRYGYYLPGTTIYQDVKEVLPGHYLKWSPAGKVEQNSYWRLKIRPFQGSKKSADAALKETLISAVKKRLVSDVEVGAFLSGGIDSSIVVGILGQYLGISPKTFSIGFLDKGFDERRFARMVAKKFHTDHHEKVVRVDEFNELIHLVLGHVGQPFADSSLLPSAAVAKLASSQVKVALSGDGADELFSGYARYQTRMVMRWYTRLPAGIRNNIERLTKALPEPFFAFGRNMVKNARLFMDIEKRYQDEIPYVSPLMYAKEDFKHLVPDLCDLGHRPPKLPDITHLDDIHTMMVADALVYLPQDNLLKVDRASMAHSLEVRAPFVDHEVVELAFNLPRDWHRKGFAGKQMLRDNFKVLLPEPLWKRKKQGFAVPVHAWFRQGLEIKLEELLHTTETHINKDFVFKLIREHRRSSHDHGYRLWNIFIFLFWKQSSKIRQS